MRITERPLGTAIVLDVRGALAGPHAAEALRTVTLKLCSEGVHVVVANLGAVSAIDLNGLGALLEAQRALARIGGVLKLAGLTRSVHDLVVITRLLTMVEAYDTVEQAAGKLVAGPATIAPLGFSPISLGTIDRFFRRASSSAA